MPLNCLAKTGALAFLLYKRNCSIFNVRAVMDTINCSSTQNREVFSCIKAASELQKDLDKILRVLQYGCTTNYTKEVLVTLRS